MAFGTTALILLGATIPEMSLVLEHEIRLESLPKAGENILFISLVSHPICHTLTV